MQKKKPKRNSYLERGSVMGTIIIKNLSTIHDRAAVSLIADYWTGGTDESELDLLGIKIIKKGHTFTIIERNGEKQNERVHID